ncbi:unnamed protein product [Vicia faba]|uniref:Uncharacterized protein n=1 Tax=Vicia faba TaxID=3906 RepID=A0AAV0Z951_VICFA|nr:unnamed protein product [Vicia faba]
MRDFNLFIKDMNLIDIPFKDLSDHCRIWITINNSNWGPKPFKVNNNWFDDKKFVIFMEKELKRLKVFSRGDYIIKEKLRPLKEHLIHWNMEVFGRNEMELDIRKDDINKIGELLSCCSSNPVEDLVVKRKQS